MQALLEITAAVVLWAATLAFSRFGIELDLPQPPASASVAARRAPLPDASKKTPMYFPCPDANTVEIRPV